MLEPIRRTIVVDWEPEAAFSRWTEGMGTWWPLATHSLGEDRSEAVVFEGRVGGRIVERVRGGAEHVWGTVTAYEPPHRVAFTWYPGRPPESAQDVEVRFEAAGHGTRVVLTASGWERYGADAGKARRGYAIGWAYMLDLWADRMTLRRLLLGAVTMMVTAVRRVRRRG